MRSQSIFVALVGALALAACAKKAEPVAEAPPPPAPIVAQPVLPGAVAGSTAADRDGDGLVDGYYTPDGIYHPAVTPAAPPPALASARGERG